jgi:hypothetical protein
MARIHGPVDLHALRLRIRHRLQRRLQFQTAHIVGRRQQRDLLVTKRPVARHPRGDGPSERQLRLLDCSLVQLLVVGDRGLLHNAEHVGASCRPEHGGVATP